MTLTHKEDATPIDTMRLSDPDAAELEASCGYIVSQVPMPGEHHTIQRVQVATESQAWGIAAGLAQRHPGLTFAVYRPSRVYHLEQGGSPCT